jgi:hypothetical protein
MGWLEARYEPIERTAAWEVADPIRRWEETVRRHKLHHTLSRKKTAMFDEVMLASRP